jgi:hypothetical protein
MKKQKTVTIAIIAFACNLIFLELALAQSGTIAGAKDSVDLKITRIKAGNLFIGYSPLSLIGVFKTLQGSVEVGLSDNVSLAIEVGHIFRSSDKDMKNLAGFRLRPSIRFYIPSSRFNYEIFYNHREARLNDPNELKLSNIIKTYNTRGLGLGINYEMSIDKKLIASLGIGLGLANGYIEYTPEVKQPNTSGGWGSGFELGGSLDDLEIFNDPLHLSSLPKETGHFPTLVGFFNVKLAYQLF